TVEVNSSFYMLPKRPAVARWVEQVPPGFVFAVKVSRFLTHMKRLTDVADGMRRLAERIEPITERGCLGPLLWQLPPQFKRNDERELGEWAARLRKLANRREVFCLFNNDWEGFAPRNALRLNRLLNG